MLASTNWNKIKGDIIKEIKNVSNDFQRKAMNDAYDKLKDKGIDSSKLEMGDNKITFSTDDIQEFEYGAVYFDEVYEEISKDNWLESIK